MICVSKLPFGSLAAETIRDSLFPFRRPETFGSSVSGWRDELTHYLVVSGAYLSVVGFSGTIKNCSSTCLQISCTLKMTCLHFERLSSCCWNHY